MLSCLKVVGESYIKNINVRDKNYEVRISDYVCGCAGWFSVKIWENKKRIFVPPIIDFNTSEDPLVVAEQQILKYIVKNEKYHKILERLESEQP